MSDQNKEFPIIHEGEQYNCKIIKDNNEGFVAECKVNPECPGCAKAIAVGWALNYIKPLNEAKADEIFEQVTNDKISADRAMDECVVVAKEGGDKELVDTLEHLKVIMHKPLSELEMEMKKNDGTT